MDRKGLVIGIIILLIGVNTNLSYARDISVETTSTAIYNGDTLYVGGSGPNNYTKIQDAIDNASNGDTVFVYDDSSPYFENLVINKTINLVGENRDSTIIDGKKSSCVVCIISDTDNVRICNFHLKNSNMDLDEMAIHISSYSDNNIITGNIISNREGIIMEEYSCGNIISNNTIDSWIRGIRLIHSDENIICENIITDSTDSAIGLHHSSNNVITGNNIVDNSALGIILFEFSHNNTISGNIINNSYEGIFCVEGDHNVVSENKITNNKYGISMHFSINNDVYWNNITNNDIGIGVYYSLNNNIYENNFFNNEKDSSWQNRALEMLLFPCRNRWDGNYWGRSRVMPKPIFGFIYFGAIGNLPLLLPWAQFDFHPAQEPYEMK